MPGMCYKRGMRVRLVPNQWNKNLRFLYLGRPASGVAIPNQRNFAHRGMTGYTGSGAGTTNIPLRPAPRGPAPSFPGNVECFLEFSNAGRSINEERFLGAVTMIASVRCRVGGTGTNYNIGGTLDSQNGFCITAVGNNTTATWAGFTRETGSTHSVTTPRKDLTVGNFTTDVVAMRLHPPSGVMDVFVDGRLANTGTSTTKVWNTTDSLDWKLAGFPGDNTSERFIGEIFWIAIFKAFLPSAVIWKWSRYMNPASIFQTDVFPSPGNTALLPGLGPLVGKGGLIGPNLHQNSMLVG